ncbi:MAG TPA: molecular chaperone HtpG [Bacteroidia bacterium]|nr:molecular chaperone HtpG [Bacteroidia bacterium]
MSTGKINVQTENIFPIIKKFLYSDHEIFLRELVSNAVDASQKIKTLASAGEFQGELGELFVEVKLDKEAKTLTISDRGVGMTADEIDRYINQIAFSGAEEFVAKYKDKMDSSAIIGHFGLGFYSAFMVAEKVEIITRSFRESDENNAVHWECDGSPEFTLNTTTRADRGTDIILHLNEDSIEFNETHRISELLNKYCKFLPVEIRFEGKTINNTNPAWTKKPSELKEEDYNAFYKELYPFSEDPLFHIHLNVDYPFSLTGILYFPRLKKNIEAQKNKIQLYSNQVFVTDSVEGIVPDFLMLLHGVIDSPDIPLNVSRSYLQSDTNVKKISSHITKKVADRLEEIFKENRADFESKWDDIGVFIKYGMLSDEKFYDRAFKFCLLKNTENQFFTFEEYRQKVAPLQTDKENKLVYLYSSHAEDQHAFVEAAKGRGYDVLSLEGPIDAHFLNHMEMKLENTSFVRVDAETIDKLIVKEEESVSILTSEQLDQIKKIAEQNAPKEQFSVVLENLQPSDQPVVITRPEFMRRMKEMSAVGGGGYAFMGEMKENFNVIVNTNHPLMSKILADTDAEKQGLKMKQAIDLARLSQNLLKGEELTKFINKSIELL